MPEHYRIKITCSPDGDIGYEPPPPIRIRENDTVEWVCDDGDYALNFGWYTPFTKGRYNRDSGETINPDFHKKVHHGRYKYFVAVMRDGKIWTDDPDLILLP